MSIQRFLIQSLFNYLKKKFRLNVYERLVTEGGVIAIIKDDKIVMNVSNWYLKSIIL
jgi:hypothetical protein